MVEVGKKGWQGPLQRVDAYRWQIPPAYKPEMRVPGEIFADDELIEQIRGDQAVEQVVNVATLPGICTASMAMPDIHFGYGFPIGGVAATDPAEGGVVSPGGVGYDINCGVRLMRTRLSRDDVGEQLDPLMSLLHKRVPSGVGRGGRYKFHGKQMHKLLRGGVEHLEQCGYATRGDRDHTEAGGRMPGAVPDRLSEKVLRRGEDQCGTLGAGNHFLEVQVVEEVVDATAAEALGLEPGRLCVMIHSGSRGLGHQVCDDALKAMRGTPKKYGFDLPDKQLVCAPVDSPEGRAYLEAMCCAANFAWANRQLLMWQVREALAEFTGEPWESLGLTLVYDVAHNIAKLEEHAVEGRRRELCVHRKGATRAFPADHPETPEAYRHVGQPVIIPGDMGRESWVLVGQPGSMERSFGSTCHGAGRLMSRSAAVKSAKGRRIDRELAERGIVAKCRSWKGLAEEQSSAYKDVRGVVDVVDRAGLAAKVARLRPIGVVKG
ncbi:MAG: RtcB family protein [Pirellulales bacterium]